MSDVIPAGGDAQATPTDTNIPEEQLDQAMATVMADVAVEPSEDYPDAIRTERFGWVQVTAPTVGATFDSRQFYSKAVQHHINSGVVSRGGILKRLNETGVYTVKEEQELRRMGQTMEGYQKAYAETEKVTDADAKAAAKKELEDKMTDLQAKIDFINQPLQQELETSAEALAESDRWLFVATRCVRYKKDDLEKGITAGMPLWSSVQALRDEVQDADVNEILDGFNRVRAGYPLKFSAPSPEEPAQPADDGATSGE